MSKVLKDPDKVKVKTGGKYPFDFKAPTYDNRTSGSISAGDYYGVGIRQPVGTEKYSGVESGPIDRKSECFSPDRIFKGEDKRG